MPELMVDTVSVALRQQLLATGRFVAGIPASTLRSNIQAGILKVLPVALPDKPWPVAMITLKNRTLAPAVQQFIELARISTRAPARTRKGRVF
jgi:DNA-binding transcriptional LysR family regulator